MSFDKLEDHLWLHILDFLSVSIPKPLSGLTKQEAVEEPDEVVAQLPNSGEPGVTSRRDIRARELAILMWKSIAFNRLASVPLYRTVISDNLTGLLLYYDAPAAHPHIQSKVELLRHTRHLSLEYGEKTVTSRRNPGDATYGGILSRPGMWDFIGRSSYQIAMLILSLEVDRLFQGALRTEHRFRHAPFPTLTRLTVGAIFGGQDEVWVVAGETDWPSGTGTDLWVGPEKQIRNALTSCQKAMVAIFAGSPITQFCQRGYAGPFSLPKAFHWVDESWQTTPRTNPQFTFHYTVDSPTTRVPAAIGNPNRWFLERPTPSANLANLLQNINSSFLLTHDERDRLWADPRTRLDKRKKPTFQISVYGNTRGLSSPSAPKKEHDERGIITGMNPMLYQERGTAKAFRKGEVDDVVWRLMDECPSCDTCGWAYDETVKRLGKGWKR